MVFPFTYLVLAVFIFGLNIIPALMPPTWIFLVFFYLTFHLDLLPTVLIGASCATLGRVVLALLVQQLHPHLPTKMQKNVTMLGKYFNTHMHVTIPVIFGYAFLPIPSNHVYIAAGLAKVQLRLMALSFFMGRLITYSLWITASHKIASSLQAIFQRYYTKQNFWVGEAIGFVLLIAFLKVNWKKILWWKS